MRSGTSAWTAEVITTFYELLEVRPKLHYSIIAKRLNAKHGTSFTKNACIGYGRRSGVPLRNIDPKQPRPNPPKSNGRSWPAWQRKKQLGQLKLEELGADDCRWPEGDRSPFLFCGAPKHTGCSYCVEHARRAFNPHWRPTEG